MLSTLNYVKSIKSFWCESGLHAALKMDTKVAYSYIWVPEQFVNLISSLNLALFAWFWNTINKRTEKC